MKKFIDIKPYLTFLSRNKIYTAINVFGFSISLMFVLLIGIYAVQEYSIDSIHSKADRIYSLGMVQEGKNGEKFDIDGSHWAVQKYLRSRYPDIEKTCGFGRDSYPLTTPTGEKMNIKLGFADSTFFQIFDFQLTRGDRNTVLTAPNSAVITSELAKKLFGQVDPIGKTIAYLDSVSVKVTGIMEPFEGSSIQKCDMIIRYENISYLNSSLTNDRMSNANGGNIFILARQGADLKSKESDMTKYFSTFFWVFMMKDTNVKALLTPLKDLYFSDTVGQSTARGDIKLVRILMGVGLIILLFSITNYINLTVAQSNRRAKEMATRRLLGSQRSEIIMRLVTESILMCAVSMAIGIVLAVLGAPVAEKLLNTELSIATLLHPSFMAAIIFIVLAVGLVSGIIPAFVISRAKPIDVVRGTFTRHSRMVLSRIFMTLQNVITITMIGVSLTMVLQVDHLVSAPLGYDKENLMKIDFWVSDHSKVDAFRNELNSLPCVVKTSFCKGTPIDRGNNNTIIFPDGKEISFQVLIGDSCYFDILGLKIARDNHVADVNGAYVNNQTLKEAELKEDAKSMKYSLDGDPISIRGIMAPFQLGDITTFESPVLIFIHKKISDPWSILIKIKGDPIEAYNSVKDVYKTTFGMELTQDKPYIDQIVQDNFDEQIRISKIVSLFAGIAIIISLLGLVAMSQYFIQQRQREIAVRKVFGSTSRQVCFRLLRSFMIYVAIAFVIAIPIIWYFMSDWLSDYSYRISLSPWIFVAAGAFCFVVSLLAVVIQSNIAANENPIRHIKDNG